MKNQAYVAKRNRKLLESVNSKEGARDVIIGTTKHRYEESHEK